MQPYTTSCIEGQLAAAFVVQDSSQPDSAVGVLWGLTDVSFQNKYDAYKICQYWKLFGFACDWHLQVIDGVLQWKGLFETQPDHLPRELFTVWLHTSSQSSTE